MYLDGAPILRLPKFSYSTYNNADEYDTLELIAHAKSGAYIGRSRYDGISRLTAYETFNDEQPLFLYYSRTTDSIFRESDLHGDRASADRHVGHQDLNHRQSPSPTPQDGR